MFVVRCSTNFYHRAHTRFLGKKGFELPKKSTARPLILSPQPHGSPVFQTPLHGFLSHNIILLHIVLLLLSGVLGFPRASTTQRRCGQGSFGDRGWQPPRSVYSLLTRITSWGLAFWTSTAKPGSGTIPFNLILICEKIVFISPLFPLLQLLRFISDCWHDSILYKSLRDTMGVRVLHHWLPLFIWACPHHFPRPTRRGGGVDCHEEKWASTSMCGFHWLLAFRQFRMQRWPREQFYFPGYPHMISFWWKWVFEHPKVRSWGGWCTRVSPSKFSQKRAQVYKMGYFLFFFVMGG